MQRASFFAVPTLLLLGLSPAQEPRRESEPKPVPTKRAQIEIKKLVRAMQGAWRLVNIELVAHDANFQLDNVSLDHSGFALVHGHYMSIEFHFRLFGQQQGDLGRSFVTGIHRFEVEEDGRLETSCVIGTRTNENGKPAFEPPDSKRVYTITMEGEQMTLLRDDGHTLVFERLLDDRSRIDFWGTQVEEKDDFYDDPLPEKKDDEKDGDEDG